MQLIETVNLSSTITTITNIPQDGRDLIVLIRARVNANAENKQFFVGFNNVTTSVYSSTRIRANANVMSVASQKNTATPVTGEVASTNTQGGANTFGFITLYISEYAANIEKTSLSLSSVPANSSNSPMSLISHVFKNTGAITSINLFAGSSQTISGRASLYKIG